MYLPSDCIKTDDKKAEEVTIPARDNSSALDIGKNLVPVDSLDETGRVAFKGMKRLNRIQSVVCDSAYRTNENLLVCAPTGAGKTNVAMLCIVQCIKQHILNGVVKKDSFKVVYVAPMKALAAEMTETFGKRYDRLCNVKTEISNLLGTNYKLCLPSLDSVRLAPLGITVKELTGDMQLTKSEIMHTQMLVTTPEKWDVVTRKPGDVELAELVRLLIIDEVHLLHGDRGPVVEALVMTASYQTFKYYLFFPKTMPWHVI